MLHSESTKGSVTGVDTVIGHQEAIYYEKGGLVQSCKLGKHTDYHDSL